MKNLTWKVFLRRNCDEKISASLKIKYKETVCKVSIPDIEDVESGDAFDKQFRDALKTAFGKKKGKKIADKVMKELSEL